MPVQRWPVSLVTDQGRKLRTGWSVDQTDRIGLKSAGFSDPGAVRSQIFKFPYSWSSQGFDTTQ